MLPQAGIDRFKGRDTSRWSNPASRMKRHRYQQKHTSWNATRLKSPSTPTDVVNTDTYSTDMKKPHPPYFQVFVDKVVPVAWVYPMFHKSELLSKFQEHVSDFYKPLILAGDAALELQHGDTERWCHANAIQVRSGTPHHQEQNECERFIHRMSNLATYAMLDSQVPPQFTIYATRHA